MKISKVTSYVLEQELPIKQQFAFSQALVKKRSVLICKITTEEGIVGWGEAFGPAKIHKSIIDNYYKPFLLGKDPFDSQFIWDSLYNMLRDSGQKGVTIQSLSAIDIALWDIKGKQCKRPIYQLMGGAYRRELKAYATGMYRKYTNNELGETVEEALEYCKQGFKAIKIKIGFGRDYDVALVKATREALGNEIEIMLDANHAYNATTAIQVGLELEEFKITWFEEPVPPEDLQGYLEVKSKLSIPIAGGEAEFTRYGMANLINNRCINILQPDCSITGGLSEYMKILTLCSIANIQCFPHVWGSGIALATGIHAAFATPDFPPALEAAPSYLEYDRTSNIFREELATGIPILKDGQIHLPNKPGLGIEINEEILKSYSIE